ncbi:MAG: hypothetical protein PHS54_07580 [Clostridia bacterium]|nr:hypothetical protein [Clostridia bacterium]
MKKLEITDDLKSHFLNLYSIALSDCQIDTVELNLLYRIGEENNVPKESIEYLILHPNDVRFTMPDDILKKIEYLFDFARMIYADKVIDPAEVQIMKKFCSKFGFADENLEELANFFINEVQKGTSKHEIFNIVNQNLNK